MKSYNSIPFWNKGLFGENCIAQNKLDGSSMRFEWSKNSGFYKFGTKNTMISEKDENFGDGISIFLNKYNEDLNRIFRDKYPKIINFVVFGEYFGENSFAGQHVKSDKKDVVIFDISVYKKGLMDVYEFMDKFGTLDIPEVIYEGKYTMDFINDVRNNIYNLSEGVVCKGISKTKKNNDSTWISKVKSDHWLELVREKFGEKGLLEELNNDESLLEKIKNKNGN